ncbi:tetratricopeptide repeat protein [Tenacibaculum tangerinum]|uniref:Tetratricopeptide repeat protein n=1 Tax=Tenacibaculum tangerinum TaxID=3038772 RepID=A0ABY8KZM8_9FLAO|nr:tetratricopeptide repeat protein [Tenacibaculum tangerinum]WGH74515.1 tetratricopeptide repeat protein [Tenacibaculum tangerinum]
MKSYKLFLIVTFLITSIFNGFSQEVQSATLKYTPADNGFELNIPFKWKFINCYGEVHVTITKNSKNITSQAYIYKGKRYTVSELGAEAFNRPECGLTDLKVDLYNNAYRLGEAKLANVIDWLGGCFGQTYHITKLIGLKDSDYKEKLANLSLKNIRFLTVSSRDYKLEGKIKELEKRKSLKSKINEADKAFNSGDYENAKSLYEAALKIDYSNEHAKNKLKEINQKIKAEKEKLELKKQLNKAKELYNNGDYESAKAAYEKALKMNPNSSEAKSMLNTINEKLKEEAEKKEKERKEKEKNAAVENAKRKEKEKAVSSANSRKHSGVIWGKGTLSKMSQSGSSFQETNLIGLFKVDYDIWTLSGQPAHRYKFYWEWDDALYTGYPQYVSVLRDKVIHIADFKKYPSLLARWNAIKPLYIELECDILYFKNGDEYIADKGTIKIIPEVIGKSGQVVEWSLPASPKWDELFTYTNGMNWSYFRNLGLYEEVNEYAKQFSTSVAWPKYAFEYSNDINFFRSHTYLTSNWIKIGSEEYKNYSTSIRIKKTIWPEEKMMALIEEFQVLEKRAKEEKMDAEDFWNTSENDEKTESTDFWDTPDNAKTVSDVKREKEVLKNRATISKRSPVIAEQRKKYKSLKEPIKISSKLSSLTPRYQLRGKLPRYFKNLTIKIIHGKEVFFSKIDNSGKFSKEIKLQKGINKLQLMLVANKAGKTALKTKDMSVNFVPELDGEGTVTSKNVKITVVDHNSVQDDYYQLYVNDKYVGDVFNRPGRSTTINTVFEPGDNYIELRLYRKKGKGTALKIIINDGEFSKPFSGSKNHKYIISAPFD